MEDPAALRQPPPILLPLFLAVLVITIYFGVKTGIHNQDNDAHLNRQQGGLHFAGKGLAFIENLGPCLEGWDGAGFTLHLKIRPKALDRVGFRPILLFHNGRDQAQLALWHWGASLILMNGDDYDFTRRLPRVSSPKQEGLKPDEAHLVTLVADSSVTTLYLDGSEIDANPHWQASIPLRPEAPRLLLGNSVYASHGWKGAIDELSLYGHPLTASEVRGLALQKDGLPAASPLFAFSFGQEKDGQNSMAGCLDARLYLPPQLAAIKHVVLGLPEKSNLRSALFYRDILINFLGFLPFGFFMYLYLCWGKTSATAAPARLVVLASFSLSLAMELLQATLIGRNSSLLDVAVNTTGGFFGVLAAIVLFAAMGRGHR